MRPITQIGVAVACGKLPSNISYNSARSLPRHGSQWVPTVDTLVAQHLLKTVSAIRLMGADAIISGIRPQIAHTIVHLGIDLQSIATKTTVADALQLAMKKSGFVVTRYKP